MKTICIYHSRDLDGCMSGAIVKHWWLSQYIDTNILNIVRELNRIDLKARVSGEIQESIEFLGWDYGDPIPDLSEYDEVIMCDVSFPVEVMIELQSKDFTYIDHHISAIKQLPNGFTVKGLLETNFAACELTWKYFFPEKEMPEIVRLLGMYDSFRHKGTDEEQKVLEFQYGARQTISNYEEAYEYLNWEINKSDYSESKVDDILSNGKAIYQYLCTEAKQTYSKSFEILLEEPEGLKYTDGNLPYVAKFLCVNQERFNPINFGIDYHKKEYDGFACFWYKDGKWSWSLYNDNGEVDCSVIAKQYSGGGHRGASGFVCDNKTMLKIISNE